MAGFRKSTLQIVIKPALGNLEFNLNIDEYKFQDQHKEHIRMTDISTDTAIASNSTTARTLATRFADIISVEDYGVVNDPNGSYVTTNTAAYQAALNAGAGVARVRHRTGLTVFVTGVSIPSNSSLELDGLLKLAAGSVMSVISVPGSNYSITGIGIIDGNSSIVISGTYGIAGIWTPNNYAGGQPALQPTLQAKGYIAGLTIQNCKNWPVCIAYTQDVIIENCVMQDSGDAPQFVGECTNCHFISNKFLNIPDYAPAIYQGGTNCSIVGNYSYNCATAGVLNDGGFTNAVNGILIKDNQFVNSTAQGITIHSSVENLLFQNISIIDNLIINPTLSSGNTGDGIFTDAVSGLIISGNLITGGGNGAAGENAIQIGSATTGTGVTLITNNIIRNFNSVGRGSGTCGIWVANPMPNLTISNNMIVDTQSTPVLEKGIFWAGLGTGNVIVGNQISSNVSSPYQTSGFQLDTVFNAAANQQNQPTMVTSIQLHYQGGAITVSQLVSEVLFYSLSPIVATELTLQPPAQSTDGSTTALSIFTVAEIESISWTLPSGYTLQGPSLPTSLASGQSVLLKYYPSLKTILHVVPV